MSVSKMVTLHGDKISTSTTRVIMIGVIKSLTNLVWPIFKISSWKQMDILLKKNPLSNYVCHTEFIHPQQLLKFKMF